MGNQKVFAVAKSENVLLFQSLGFQTYLVQDEVDLKKAMDEVMADAQIIIVDEELDVMMSDYRKHASEKAFPIILALPIDHKATGQGLAKLRGDVEKAIGIKLF
ncbi:MAG: V-type ATP synthase subunit F [Bacilli bacterium]|jgi:vacuolar-type H+-ATPase subunit F/Vma7